jgi:hypothetical protein
MHWQAEKNRFDSYNSTGYTAYNKQTNGRITMTAFTFNNESTVDKLINLLFPTVTQEEKDEVDYLIWLRNQGIPYGEITTPVANYFPPNGILTFQEWLDY